MCVHKIKRKYNSMLRVVGLRMILSMFLCFSVFSRFSTINVHYFCNRGKNYNPSSFFTFKFFISWFSYSN